MRTANTDGDSDEPSTQPPAPSPADPTRTSASAVAGAAPPGRTSSPHQSAPRDRQRYHVLGEHGRGGLGRVSRVHDLELGRDIAIKELIARSHVSEMRFLREALITARLEHPGIVPVYEAGRWPDGTPFYAMKLVAGRSLRDLIAERAGDDRIGLLHHVIAVADAIAYAHGRNIIHRDLKPANVIVGDFGETVVIDWGLAKDLTADDEPTIGGGPFRETLGDGLTSAGSVLGTPAYMAPEQERGDRVDRRADVYAIGAMLWELCSLGRVPAGSARDRHRALRRAGIDDDLAAIIDKALDPDPDRRYPHAGALAADLKAFKAGARIAARRYSPWAMLAHWVRRHRTLAGAAAALLGLALAGGALYLRAVTAERDRADGSEQRARRALDELTLRHAQVLLASDPSAAVDVLADYHGADDDRAGQIRAEATGRGVAFVRAQPHTDRIRWVHAVSGGDILSLSVDGTLARTSPDGRSAIVVRNVARSGEHVYAPSRHLLAYVCNPTDVCFYDTARDLRISAAPELRGTDPIRIAFSPSGALLGIMTSGAELIVLDVADPARPRVRLRQAIYHGNDVRFFEDDIVVANTVEGLEFIHLGGGSERFAVPDNSYWDASPDEHLFAIANFHGAVQIMEGSPVLASAHAELCHGRVAGLQFLAGRRSLAYACRDGDVGVWDLARNSHERRLRLDGHVEVIAVGGGGDYLAAAGDTGTVAVLDLVTDLVTSYKGHAGRVNALALPDAEAPFVVSGDVHGALRGWRPPSRIVRVAATSDSRFYAAFFDERATTLTATTFLPELTRYAPATGVHSFGPHHEAYIWLAASPHSRWFASHGKGDTVELWSSAPLARTREFTTHHGSISQLIVPDDSGDIITAGHDGRVVRWSAAGDETVLARADQPIDGFVILAAGGVVFASADGALWRTSTGPAATQLRPAGPRVVRLAATGDGRTIYAGLASGDLLAIDTATWQAQRALHADGAIQTLSLTPDGDALAVSTSHGTVHLATRAAVPPGGTGAAPLTWRSFELQARDQALTRDGLLVIGTTDGNLWIHAIRRRQWLCIPTGPADLRSLSLSSTATTAAVTDYEGRLLWVDLDAARRQLAGSLPTTKAPP